MGNCQRCGCPRWEPRPDSDDRRWYRHIAESHQQGAWHEDIKNASLLKCSFCGTPAYNGNDEEQRRLIGGSDGVQICNVCIGLANEMLADELPVNDPDDDAGEEFTGRWPEPDMMYREVMDAITRFGREDGCTPEVWIGRAVRYIAVRRLNRQSVHWPPKEDAQ